MLRARLARPTTSRRKRCSTRQRVSGSLVGDTWTGLESATLYFYLDEGIDGGRWILGDELPGWVSANDVASKVVDGQQYIGVVVTHGGLVQVGVRPHASEATIAGQHRLGDWLLMFGFAMLVLGARFAPVARKR